MGRRARRRRYWLRVRRPERGPAGGEKIARCGVGRKVIAGRRHDRQCWRRDMDTQFMRGPGRRGGGFDRAGERVSTLADGRLLPRKLHRCRSEEHTSELQSLMRISYAVFCLKKKKKMNKH